MNQSKICLNWLNGNCGPNDSCQYYHPKKGEGYVPPKCQNGFLCNKPHCRFNHIICKNYLATQCKMGDLCKFHHPINTGKKSNTKQKCKNGILCSLVTCKFNHSICPHWANNHQCRYGVNCQNQHPYISQVVSYYERSYYDNYIPCTEKHTFPVSTDNEDNEDNESKDVEVSDANNSQ